MKQEKYNICIERELLRLNSKAKMVDIKYPKLFDDKNNFITTKENENILILKTPIEKNIIDVYSKFEEITNVVYVKAYNLNEIIWPFSKYEDYKLSNKVIVSIDKDYYEKIRYLNNNLPNTLQEAYEVLKEEFKIKSSLIEKVFRKMLIKNIKEQYSNF